MILLIGTQEDSTTFYFKEFLESKGAKYFFLDQHLLSQDKINLFSDHLTFQNSKHYYAEFSGALNRMSYADLTGLSSLAISKELGKTTMLNYIVTYKIKNVLNQSYFSISNDSKLLQLELIRNHTKHIKVPESIVLKNVIIDEIKIYSNTVDYRYENTLIKFEHTSLPKDIEQECLQIAEVLNLKFAGIDLLLTN
jgi:hypothetical protein